MPELILASSSVFRAELLAKLQLPFRSQSPEVDESAQPGESIEALVARLSLSKARAVANSLLKTEAALIIGSDQLACRGEQILGKPGNADNALAQLQSLSGHWVDFHTGLCLYNNQTGNHQLHVERFSVKFRHLSEQQLRAYIAKDQPLNCAGAFKSEALGISLFEEMRGRDPNSLIGLPLIQLVSFLAQEGVDPLAQSTAD